MGDKLEPKADGKKDIGWTFLSNHGHVLFCLIQNPSAKLTEVSKLVGVTPRAVQRIVGDLEEAGVVTKHRRGRRNLYEINVKAALRHPLESHVRIGELLKTLLLR